MFRQAVNDLLQNVPQTQRDAFRQINLLAFISERERVYCAVRAESLNKIQVSLSIVKGQIKGTSQG